MNLPMVPTIQPGKASYWTFNKSLKRGHLCVIGLTRRAAGPGTYRLDRIAQLRKAPGNRGMEITAVESGTPITLNRPDAWDGERHWFTYALDTAPSDIRAADLWEWWVGEGRPNWRTSQRVTAAIRQFFRVDEAAA